MTHASELVEAVRREADTEGEQSERAQRIAELIRSRTGRRWIGIYRVTDTEVSNLAWSGIGAPAHPTFPIDRGLTGVAIAARSTVVSNDVRSDARYLTNQDSTGSELIVPVLVDSTVVGTLDVEDGSTDAFSPEDRELFEALATALSDLYT
jgi:putative methionine-R-sulfoxide reductase with GAF domain